jgi:hypothetical protein
MRSILCLSLTRPPPRALPASLRDSARSNGAACAGVRQVPANRWTRSPEQSSTSTASRIDMSARGQALKRFRRHAVEPGDAPPADGFHCFRASKMDCDPCSPEPQCAPHSPRSRAPSTRDPATWRAVERGTLASTELPTWPYANCAIVMRFCGLRVIPEEA